LSTYFLQNRRAAMSKEHASKISELVDDQASNDDRNP
jgi:hypothetical protein